MYIFSAGFRLVRLATACNLLRLPASGWGEWPFVAGVRPWQHRVIVLCRQPWDLCSVYVQNSSWGWISLAVPSVLCRLPARYHCLSVLRAQCGFTPVPVARAAAGFWLSWVIDSIWWSNLNSVKGLRERLAQLNYQPAAPPPCETAPKASDRHH